MQFIKPLREGQECVLPLEPGKTLVVKFLATGNLRDDGNREVFFELNGVQRSVYVFDKQAAASAPQALKRKADKGDDKHLGNTA